MSPYRFLPQAATTLLEETGVQCFFPQWSKWFWTPSLPMAAQRPFIGGKESAQESWQTGKCAHLGCPSSLQVFQTDQHSPYFKQINTEPFKADSSRAHEALPGLAGKAEGFGFW